MLFLEWIFYLVLQIRIFQLVSQKELGFEERSDQWQRAKPLGYLHLDVFRKQQICKKNTFDLITRGYDKKTQQRVVWFSMVPTWYLLIFFFQSLVSSVNMMFHVYCVQFFRWMNFFTKTYVFIIEFTIS